MQRKHRIFSLEGFLIAGSRQTMCRDTLPYHRLRMALKKVVSYKRCLSNQHQSIINIYAKNGFEAEMESLGGLERQ